MKRLFKQLPALTLAAGTLLGLGSSSALAQGKTITLCWADRKSTRLNSSH